MPDVTVNGVSLEFQPPTESHDEKEVLLVSADRLESVNRRLAGTGWYWEEVRRVNGIPVYELKRQTTTY